MFSMFEYSARKPPKGKGWKTASWQSDHLILPLRSRKRDGGKEVAETPWVPGAYPPYVEMGQWVDTKLGLITEQV